MRIIVIEKAEKVEKIEKTEKTEKTEKVMVGIALGAPGHSRKK